MANSGNRQDPQSGRRRTRRNVLAIAGLLGSTAVAAIAGLTKNASARIHHHAPCFLPGTRLQTPDGLMAIENMRAGDVVLTASGGTQIIKRIETWRAERNADGTWAPSVAPIKVARSALAPNVPARDLFVSPLHALYIDGVLIRAGALVNGRTIVRCSNYEAGTLDYLHVELDGHHVILAEGAPVESLLTAQMVACAPIGIGGGRRAELASRMRSAVSPWVDTRTAFDKARDRLEAEAETALAA